MKAPIAPARPGCPSCDAEPLLEMPEEPRQRTAIWAWWQMHVALHNLGRIILDTIRR